MITLKIDTQALRTLFPEGSEARLELQKAVIMNVAREVGVSQANAALGELRGIVEEAAKQAAYSLTKEYLEQKGHFFQSKTQLTNQLIIKIKEEMRQIVDGEIMDTLRKVRDEFIQTQSPILQGQIAARVEVVTNHLIDKTVKEMVVEKFKAALQSIEVK